MISLSTDAAGTATAISNLFTHTKNYLSKFRKQRIIKRFFFNCFIAHVCDVLRTFPRKISRSRKTQRRMLFKDWH